MMFKIPIAYSRIECYLKELSVKDAKAVPWCSKWQLRSFQYCGGCLNVIFFTSLCNCIQKWMAALDVSIRKGKQAREASYDMVAM